MLHAAGLPDGAILDDLDEEEPPRVREPGDAIERRGLVLGAAGGRHPLEVVEMAAP
ncbi:MAG: hypothetical protein R3290_12600 [Acidimicrobiia bacterium]|nr:hypothetical protein [Acidimicrobiia bacterium]